MLKRIFCEIRSFACLLPEDGYAKQCPWPRRRDYGSQTGRGQKAKSSGAAPDAVAAEVAGAWAQGRAPSISLRSRMPFLPQPAAPAGTSGRNRS